MSISPYRFGCLQQMLELIEKIKATARELRGIELETEVQIVGEDA